MRFSIIALTGLVAVATAAPALLDDIKASLPHPMTGEDKRDLQADIAAVLPHPIGGSKIVDLSATPVDMVSKRQTTGTRPFSTRRPCVQSGDIC